MGERPACFKAYDIRGKVPEELNKEMAFRVGTAFVAQFSPKKIVVGRDMRLSSPEIAEAVAEGVRACGCNVIDIGLCGTEEVYHAVFSGEADGIDGGIMVTASHNPAEYNGMKLVERGARPVFGENGLDLMADMVSDDRWFEDFVNKRPAKTGTVKQYFDKRAYIDHLLSYVDRDKLKPMKLVVNPGNGCAGLIIDLLEKHLPFSYVRLNDKPDGTFPNGVPNPLLPEKREVTAVAVREQGADLGVAWDGDFDRCFFYDEQGRFIEGYYIVGLLAATILEQHPGGAILHDPRLIWNTVDIVESAGGVPVMTRTGHAFIKDNMRKNNGLYGGEMSAHHYFREFGYCDSGMIPWLLVCQLMSTRGLKLSEMVDAMIKAYPVSGEINNKVADPESILARVREEYSDGVFDFVDGISVSYPSYRFNVRKSNTEPVLRLNVETRGDEGLLAQKTQELLKLIRSE